MRETREEAALRAAAEGPRAYCRRLRAEIRRNHLLAGADPAGRPSPLERLVTHIQNHLFEESLSVGSACKKVGIGNTAISADLRAYTRYPVNQLIARLRIEAAIHLLIRTKIKAFRIAYLVGYKTVAGFRASYEKWTGETPADTRRSKQSSQSLASLWRLRPGAAGER